MLHVLVLRVHVLLLGQVRLGSLHEGLLVHVVGLVQVQLAEAQAGHVRDRDLLPRIFQRSKKISELVKVLLFTFCEQLCLRMPSSGQATAHDCTFGAAGVRPPFWMHQKTGWQARSRCRGSWAHGSRLSSARPSGRCRGPCHKNDQVSVCVRTGQQPMGIGSTLLPLLLVSWCPVSGGLKMDSMLVM